MAFGQSDSTLCFTISQVKEFLMTKAELNNCIEQSQLLLNDLDSLNQETIQLTEANDKGKKKLKRTRWIGVGGIFSAIVLTIIVLL